LLNKRRKYQNKSKLLHVAGNSPTTTDTSTIVCITTHQPN